MDKHTITPVRTEEAIIHMKNGGLCKTQYNHNITYSNHKDAFYIEGGITFMPRYLEDEELDFWQLRKVES